METARERLKDIFEFCRDLCYSDTHTEQEIIDEFNNQLWFWRNYANEHERIRKVLENGLSKKNA